METYQSFGPYWLTLAGCYYEKQDYNKCIQAVSTYEQMNNNIFRRDFAYAQVLPLAIISAREVMTDEEYIPLAARYADAILNHTNNTDWSLRYFAAQTFIQLYSLTQDRSYPEKAYDIALNNVNYLIDNQKELNIKYPADVQEEVPGPDASKAEKEQVKQYNKMLHEERKTALPPIYEPLLLNCKLLFSLAGELNISAYESGKIEGILHEDGAPVFLTFSLDQMYRQSSSQTLPQNADAGIEFDGAKVYVPARFISENVSIKVTVSQNGQDTIVDDWTVEKIERKDPKVFSSFRATFTSKAIKECSIKPGAAIHIEVIPVKDHTSHLNGWAVRLSPHPAIAVKIMKK